MEIRPLSPGFGAEVTGFDAQSGRAPPDVAALRAAYEKWNLLIFRDCGLLVPERQVEITGWFGPIGANSDEHGRPWTVLHNENATGSAQLPFHCDISFMPYPLEGISLHPQALPDTETSTTFVSNAVAWNALPRNLQNELRELRGRHYYDSSAEMNLNWPPFEHWHPVCFEHPKSKRPLLFVTEHHVDRISDVSEDRSAELLETLFSELYAPHGGTSISGAQGTLSSGTTSRSNTPALGRLHHRKVCAHCSESRSVSTDSGSNSSECWR